MKPSLKQWSALLLLLSIIFILPGTGGLGVSHAVSPVRQSRTLPLPVAESHAFVSYKSDDKVGCREATVDEAIALKRRGSQLLHVISPDGRGRKQSLSTQSVGLKIVLRATDQLESYPAAKAAFLNAAATWESLINTPITITVDVDFGPTWFGEAYDTNVLGQTDSQVLGESSIYGEVRASLLGLATPDQRIGVYSVLPESEVPTDLGPTSYVLAPSALWRALGFINPVADPASEKRDIGDPPAVGFNSKFDYDFDPANGVDSNNIDFDSVAVHELGHVLAFTSNTGYKELERNSPVAVTIWDLFRFRPGTTLDTFSSAQRILSSGGSQDFFDGNGDVALSTGRPDGTGGDREQASHWKDDRFTGQYIGVMDPTLSDGERDVITENDLAALKSFGYAVGTAETAPEAPTITKGSFGGKKLKLTGTGFDGQIEIEINGQIIGATVAVTINESSTKLVLKARQTDLNLQSGSNQVQVIRNGIRSNAFTLTL